MRAVLVGLALFASGPAGADWQYTRWGMGADEIIAASNGKAAKPSTERLAKATKDSLGELVAVAEHKAGDFAFSVSFYGRGGRLAAVQLRPGSTETDPGLLLDQLRLTYGQPVKDETSRGSPCGTKSVAWQDRTAGNVVAFDQLTCSGNVNIVTVVYAPLPSSSGGL